MIETPWLRRLETWLFLAAAAWLLASCAPSNTIPPPPPPPTTTQPSLPPPVFEDVPLGVQGGRFVTAHGKPWWPIGVVYCCRESKSYAWPLVNERGLVLAAHHGANMVHVRTGPTVRLENRVGLDFDAYVYLPAPDRWDVQRFDEAYFKRLHDVVRWAYDLRIVVEVDLIDGWGPRQDGARERLGKPPLSPWSRENNVNGIDDGSCRMFQEAPRPVHKAFVGKIVDSVGDMPNVIWHQSNEVSLCGGTTRAWIDGIEREIRIAESQNGFVRHLYGTNAFEKDVIDSDKVQYVTSHDPDHVGTIYRKPAWVNEYRDDFSPVAWEKQAKLTKAAWSGFVLWRGDLDNDLFAETLLRMAKIQTMEAFHER